MPTRIRWEVTRLDATTLEVRAHGDEFGVAVWVSDDGFSPRCTECFGMLAAMSASCAHARAAKRFLAKASPRPSSPEGA